MVHPECTADVIELADQVLSTAGMRRYAAETDVKELIVGTEIGLLGASRGVLKSYKAFNKFMKEMSGEDAFHLTIQTHY